MSGVKTAPLSKQIKQLQKELMEGKQRLNELRRQLPKEKVPDYVFTGPDGMTISLSELFGDKDELILIHNMGKGCRYCTLWADGFNGILSHLEDRAGFAVISPDDPVVQKQFAESRGWEFKMYSGKDNTFADDMGFQSEKGDPWPGVSTFQKQSDGSIVRTGHDSFGPGDYYCSIWHLIDLLPETDEDWAPQYSY